MDVIDILMAKMLSGGGVDPEQISSAVTGWLEENVDPVGSAVVVDSSLTIEGAAADAKVTGQRMQKCTLVQIPASANKWNENEAAIGIFNTDGRIFTGGSFDNYKYYEIGGLAEGDVLSFFGGSTVTALNISRLCAKNSEGNPVTASGVSSGTTYTVPSGIVSAVVTIPKSTVNPMVLVNAAETPTEFIPFSAANEYYVAGDEFIPTSVLDGKVDKSGTDQVTAKNAAFIYKSPNLFNAETIVNNCMINQANGRVLDWNDMQASDWIEVEGGEDYTFSFGLGKAIRYAWYDSGKAYISGAQSSVSTVLTLTAPNNARYIRFSHDHLDDTTVQFEKGDTATAYMAYGSGYLKPEYATPESTDFAFNVPPKVYALVGYETNIYFENLVEDWTRYKWNVNCDKGMQLERGYRITPSADDVGTYTMTIEASLSEKVSVTKTLSLIVTAASAGSGVTKSVLIIGDSTTANGQAVTKLNENFSNDVMSITTVGTKGTPPNMHEGGSGWNFASFFANSAENPWYNPTTQTFDASYYFANSGVSAPDWLFINLGINDVFGMTNDIQLRSQISASMALCNSMIASIQSASPSTKIGLCLTIPPNHSQDAFGKAYACTQTRDRYKRNNALWVEALIAEYDNRENEEIYLIPIHLALDTIYNMGMETMPVNARNTSMTYESPIRNGGVHPVSSGYWQIADVYTAFLKSQA